MNIKRGDPSPTMCWICPFYYFYTIVQTLIYFGTPTQSLTILIKPKKNLWYQFDIISIF